MLEQEKFLAWDRQLFLGQWQWTWRGLWHPRKLQRGRREADKEMRLIRARGSAELGQVASGSAAQNFWREN